MRRATATILASLFLPVLTLPLMGAEKNGPQSIKTGFVASQPGCPVEIVATDATRDDLFDHVEVRNVSKRRILAVGFGAAIDSAPSSEAKPVFVESPVIPTVLDPGQSATVFAFFLPPQEARSKATGFGGQPLQVRLGVVEVDFDSGVSWTFNPAQAGGFNALRQAGTHRSPARVTEQAGSRS
jgi:hypothetical protein